MVLILTIESYCQSRAHVKSNRHFSNLEQRWLCYGSFIILQWSFIITMFEWLYFKIKVLPNTEYSCWRTPRLWKGKKLQINFGAGKILSKLFWFEGIPWKYIFFYWKDYKEEQFRPELLITATWIYISYISVTDK